MEWPQELLEIFDDPLLDNVHPPRMRTTSEERLLDKFREIMEWVEKNGRTPRRDGATFEERMLARALNGPMVKENVGFLKEYDRLHLLQ